MTRRFTLIYTAVFALLGALLMLVGDLLLYAHASTMPEVIDSVADRVHLRQTILLADPFHLHVSAVLGPIAAIALLFGAVHIYLRLQASSKPWAVTAVLAYGCAVVLGGTYHAIWSLNGFVLQFANTHPEVQHELIENVARSMDYFDAIIAPLTFLSFGILFFRILLGKAEYPRWAALLTPLPLILLWGVFLNDLASALPHPGPAVVKGTYFNVVMTVFFIMAAISSIQVRETEAAPSNPKDKGTVEPVKNRPDKQRSASG